MNKKVVGSLFIVVVIMLVGWVLMKNGGQGGDNSLLEENLQKVTIGIQTSPAMAVVMVAKDKGFFEQQGLDVEIKEFTAGKFALEAFFGGSLDFAVSGDVPAALAAMNNQKFVVPAQVVAKTVNEVRVVARKDGSPTNAVDYFKAKKRKLATSIGGGPEFFTYEFLNKIGIGKDQVEIISQTPQDMPAALVSGSVDAVAIFDPFAYKAEQLVGDKSITFTDESIYSELYILEAKESVRQNSEVVKKLLVGLVAAEEFIKSDREEAKQVVMKYTKLDKSTVDAIWMSFDFRVALTPQLVEYWDREYEWAKATGKIKPETEKPDFTKFLAPELLEAVKK
jgi:ABC-type nitrate/sulfonate/bicarbonate transport system substrate-binding protein